jgi:hypothetical protein
MCKGRRADVRESKRVLLRRCRAFDLMGDNWREVGTGWMVMDAGC